MISKGYFDYNATTPVAEPVLAEMLPYFRERFHNPSSFYRAACEVQNALGQARLRDFLEEEILRCIPQVLVNGRTPLRLANTLNISVKAVEGEAMLAYLDQHGLALSSGSACSAKSLEPSHVLLALGLSHQDAHGSLRISLGKYNSEEDVQRLLDVLPEVVAKLRRMSPFWADKRG